MWSWCAKSAALANPMAVTAVALMCGRVGNGGAAAEEANGVTNPHSSSAATAVRWNLITLAGKGDRSQALELDLQSKAIKGSLEVR